MKGLYAIFNWKNCGSKYKLNGDCIRKSYLTTETQRHRGVFIMGNEYAPIPDEINVISQAIIDGAFKVHKALGPGLLESVYEICLCHELQKSG